MVHCNKSVITRGTTSINYQLSHVSNNVCNVLDVRRFVAKPIATENFASFLHLLNASS